MGTRTLALTVILRNMAGETVGCQRLYAGSGRHLRIGTHADNDGFKIPMDGIAEVEVFSHRQNQRTDGDSPWNLLRPRGATVEFGNRERQPKWSPVSGFRGDACTLRADDRGRMTLADGHVLEFHHDQQG